MRTPTLVLTAALLMCLSVAPGCGRGAPEEASAETAFRELCSSLRYRYQPGILARLGPRTRSAVEAGMADGSLQLAAAWVPVAVDTASLTRRTDDAGRVWLDIESTHGGVTSIEAVQGESGWTFELALGTAAGRSADGPTP